MDGGGIAVVLYRHPVQPKIPNEPNFVPNSNKLSPFAKRKRTQFLPPHSPVVSPYSLTKSIPLKTLSVLPRVAP